MKHDTKKDGEHRIKTVIISLTAVFALSFIAAFILVRLAPSELYQIIYPENPPVVQAKEAFDVTLKKGDSVILGSYYDKPVVWKCVIFDNKPILMSNKVLDFIPFDEKSSDWENSSLRKALNSGNSLYFGDYAKLIDGEITILSKDQLKKLPASERQKQPTADAIERSKTRFLFVRKNVWYWTKSAIAGQDICVTAVTQAGGFYKSPAYDMTMGVCPSVTLNSNRVVAFGGNGTENRPYILSVTEAD